MGLLDKLLTDMIQDSTGYDARKIVRRIGGGKILLAGGAAIAGALLTDKLRQRGQQPQPPSQGGPAAGGGQALPPLPTPSAGSPPVNLPPLPGAGVSPPSAPPQAAEATAENSAGPEISPELEYAIVRTLIAAALADGHLASEERERILERVDASELPEEQVRQIHKDMVLPPTPSELAALAPKVQDRETLYTFAAVMTSSEAGLKAEEEAWLGHFATALELTPERRREIDAGLAAE